MNQFARIQDIITASFASEMLFLIDFTSFSFA